MSENGALKPILTLQMAAGYSSYIPRLSCTQTDNESICVMLKLMDQSKPYIVPEGYEINVRAEKPDGKHVYKPAVLRDGMYTFILGGQLTTAVGVSKCAIEVVKDGFVLNSAPFDVVVKPQTAPDAEIVSEDDLETLNRYVFRAESAAEKAQAATIHPPKVGANGNWEIWNPDTETYEDSGKPSKGEKGESGKDGYTPQRGVDYWTEDDVAAINNHIDDALFKTAIKLEKSGELVNITDSIEYPFLSLGIYGKTTQDGIPTPEIAIQLVSVGDSGSIDLTINNGEEQSQFISIPTPDGLPGIPVDTGGNYTDRTGQQWICDSIEKTDNGWEYVKKIAVEKSPKARTLNSYGSAGYYKYICSVGSDVTTPGLSKCNYFKTRYEYQQDDVYFYWENTNAYFYSNQWTTLEEFNAWVSEKENEGNPLMIIGVLKTPIRTPITDPELIEKLDALHLYYPVTNIFATDNAGISAKYVADTQNFIKNLLGEIAGLKAAQAGLQSVQDAMIGIE
ncbi:MAG: hypothetical protein ACOX6P_10505 [Candidatus Merdivicinus sp.]|jgi:hypothetical protein